MPGGLWVSARVYMGVVYGIWVSMDSYGSLCVL